MAHKYILDRKHNPIICNDLKKWASFFSDIKNRQVALTEKKNVAVSTVFLGLDHNFNGEGGPILFETMIFGGFHNEEMRRYRTWEEAKEGHKAMCKIAFRTGKP